MKKTVYIRQKPYEPTFIERVTVKVRETGYKKKYRDMEIDLYDTIQDTFVLNDELGYSATVKAFKQLGYVSVYVRTKYGMRQRMVKE